MQTKASYIVLFLLIAQLGTWAQYSDAGLWTNLAFEGKLVKKVRWSAEGELRFDENLTELSTAFTDLGLTYKLHDNIRLGVTYRFGNRRQTEDFYDLRMRLAFDVVLRESWDDFRVSYRFRTQLADNTLINRQDFLEFSSAFRNKLSLKYKFMKKTYAWVSGELFTREFEGEQFLLSDWRVKFGVDRKVKKKQYLTLGYLIQSETNRSNPVTDFVILLGYKFEM